MIKNSYLTSVKDTICKVIGFMALSFVVLALLQVYTPAKTSAAAPNTLNFQARLKNSSGGLAPDGNYNLEFKIYGVVSGGSALWTETLTSTNKVRVANGYLTVDLGAVTAFPSNMPWGDRLWISMNVGGTGGSPTWDGEMSPRLKLTAVPYAYRAKEATKLTDGTNTYEAKDFLQLAPNAVQLVNSNNTAINMSQKGDGGLIMLRQGEFSKEIFSINKNGVVKFALNINNSKTFAIQDAETADMFYINSNDKRVHIGNPADSTYVTLVLDAKDTSGDPTGTNGAMYYNSNDNKFRCYENGYWKDCITSGAGDPTAIHDGGDSMGQDVSIGTNDDYALELKTNNTTQLKIDTGGATTFRNSVDSNSGFLIQNASGHDIFKVNTANKKVTITGDVDGYINWNSTIYGRDYRSFVIGSAGGVAVGLIENNRGVIYGNDFGSMNNASVLPQSASMNDITQFLNTGVYVAVGDAFYGSSMTDKVAMASLDGDYWTDISINYDGANWQSVTYSPDIGTGVAVGSFFGSGSIMMSVDGVNWDVVESGVPADLKAVTYGDGKFVAVAGSGTNRVFTSSDGISWAPQSSPSANWSAVTYSEDLDLFVAVARFGAKQVMTSSDGISWTAQDAASANTWKSVVYNNYIDKFVAVADDKTSNSVMTSTDGVTWSNMALPAGANTKKWVKVQTLDNNMFIIMASDGSLLMSAEGGGSLNLAENKWRSITYDSLRGKYVAIGSSSLSSNCIITRSSDGLSWSSSSLGVPCDFVQYSASLDMLVVLSNNSTSVATSIDGGDTWVNGSYGPSQIPITGFSWTNDRFIGVTWGNSTLTSTDGVNWSVNSGALVTGTFWTSTAYGNGKYVVVSSSGGAVATSADGITWSAAATMNGNGWFAVTYGNGLFVAVAANNPNGKQVMTSTDGLTWTERDASSVAAWSAVAYGDGMFVAIAEGDKFMTSTDGINWNDVTMKDLKWRKIVYAAGKFTAISEEGDVQVMTDQVSSYKRALEVNGSSVFNGSIGVALAEADTATAVCRNSAGQLATCTSSSRFKENVEGSSYGLDDLRLLQPVTYTWKSTGQADVGFIAEQVASVIPQAVTYDENGEVASFNYNTVTSLLVSGVKDLDVVVSDIDTRLAMVEQGVFSGNVTVAEDLTVGGTSMLKTIVVDGKIISSGEVPEVETDDTSAYAEIEGNDTAGTLTFITSSSPIDGKQVTITFNKPYDEVPRITMTAGNDLAAQVKMYIEKDENSFTVYFEEPPTPGKYVFDYHVIQ